MKVNVNAVNFTVDVKLVDFVQERIGKLEKYYDKVVSSDVYLKVEKTSDKENKMAEVKMSVNSNFRTHHQSAVAEILKIGNDIWRTI